VLLNFLFIKEACKKYISRFPQKNKAAHYYVVVFLQLIWFEHQIIRSEWFLKDHVTENGGNDAENSTLHLKE